MTSSVQPVSPPTPPLNRTPPSSTDRPIPVWPEGVLALAAGAILLFVGMRHRDYLARKVREAQRAVDTFQQQGALDDVAHLAKQAASLFKSE